MRLTSDQAEAIRQRVRSYMGPHARIWLFGSRVDDTLRGGDVDLYVEPESAPTLEARLRCKSALADDLDLNVDLIVQQPGRDLPIYLGRSRWDGWRLTPDIKSTLALASWDQAQLRRA